MNVETFDGYKIIKYDDGVYGYEMADGKSMNGFKSKIAAKSAAKKLASASAQPTQQVTPREITDIEQALADELSSLYDDAAKYLVDKAKNFVSKYQTGKQYDIEALNALIKQLTAQIAKTNADAVAAINGYAPLVAAEQANFTEYAIEDGTTLNPSFTLLNQDTVLRLIKDSPAVLPKAKAKIEKNKQWNTPKLRSALTHAIVQGDSIPKLSKKVEEICGSNKAIATRNARTMMTGARNAGTLAAYVRAEQNGMHIQKQWMAALDERTRVSHRHLDGEIKPVNEKFSNGLMHPGDTEGRPAEVYNCRCTMVPIVNDQLYEGDRASKLKDMSYEEWRNAQPKPKSKPKKKKKTEGKSENKTTTPDPAEVQSNVTVSDVGPLPVKWYKNGPIGTDQINWSPENIYWVNKEAYDSYSAVIKQIKTYGDLVDYAQKKLGIPVTSKDMVAGDVLSGNAELRAKQVVAMIEQYASLGKVPNLKGIAFFDDKYQELGAYREADQDDAGWIFIRPDTSGSDESVANAFAHMYAYGTTPANETFANHSVNMGLSHKFVTTNIFDSKKEMTKVFETALTGTIDANAKSFREIVSKYPQVDHFKNAAPQKSNIVQPQAQKKESQTKKTSIPTSINGQPVDRSHLHKVDADDYQPVPTSMRKTIGNDKEYDFKTWQSADAYAREKSGEVWRNASKEERNIAYGYTGTRFKLINARLNGYEDDGYTNFVGLRKTTLAKGTKALTDMISRSTYDDAVVVYRRDSPHNLSDFTGISVDDLNAMWNSKKEFDANDFVGKSNRFMSFLSTSATKDVTYGTADKNKWVQLEIHCPAGSEMLYAEPFSRYGKGGELWWNGWDTQKDAGEREMILQRGGKYTITDIKRDKDVLRVVMELNLDEGYDKWGDE